MKLSTHFTLAEMTASITATNRHIDNTPDAAATHALQMLCERVLEPVRERMGCAIIVTSGYRCKALNTLVGGSATSQHCKGEAADIKPANGDTLALLNAIKESGIEYDQLINEYPDANGVPSWVHVSFTTKRKNRRQFLTIKRK